MSTKYSTITNDDKGVPNLDGLETESSPLDELEGSNDLIEGKYDADAMDEIVSTGIYVSSRRFVR